MENSLDLKFKGNRDYLHGTDIFNRMIELNVSNYDNIENINLVLKKISEKQLYWEYMPIGETNSSEINGVFSFSSNNQKHVFLLIESVEVVKERYDYYEDKIINRSNFILEEKTIVLDDQCDYSFIEKIVALNKALVTNIFDNVKGKWYFTKVKLSNYVESTGINKLKVVLTKNLGLRLTSSEVYVNDIRVGSIYFSLIEENI